MGSCLLKTPACACAAPIPLRYLYKSIPPCMGQYKRSHFSWRYGLGARRCAWVSSSPQPAAHCPWSMECRAIQPSVKLLSRGACSDYVECRAKLLPFESSSAARQKCAQGLPGDAKTHSISSTLSIRGRSTTALCPLLLPSIGGPSTTALYYCPLLLPSIGGCLHTQGNRIAHQQIRDSQPRFCLLLFEPRHL
jgi:hypothetical protein